MLLEGFSVPIGHYPTPLEELPRLSRAIGGARLWVKRDDLTGLAFGGSKTRALGGLLAEARSQGADTIVTCGPKTSNHVRLTAAAANRLGLHAVLVIQNKTGSSPQVRQGNMLLNTMLGAVTVHADVAALSDLERVMQQTAESLTRDGRRPFIIPGGGFAPAGSAGYLGLVDELAVQTQRLGFTPDAIVFASGSGCIQSGLLASQALRGARVPVLGVTINRSRAELEERVSSEVDATRALLGVPSSAERGSIRVLDDYLGPGYAVPSEAGVTAISMLAELEGLLLDPCYTAKAMAAAIDFAKRDFRSGQNIVFIHTGGGPGIFSYADVLLSHAERWPGVQR
jgi:L-cysteate sulfo-lyase